MGFENVKYDFEVYEMKLDYLSITVEGGENLNDECRQKRKKDGWVGKRDVRF